MRHARITTLLGCALLAIALVGCDQQRGGPRVVGEDGTEFDVTATPTETGTATIVTTAESTATPGTPETTATPDATETPSATSTATPTSTSTSSGGTSDDGGPGLLEIPYSTADVRAAVQAAGLTVEVDDEREPMCPDTSVPETAFLASEPDADAGANWAIWVYPDEEAREQDWEIEDGQLTPTSDDCELPTGFNYFNANVVIAFVSWQDGDSESTFSADQSPREHEALEAFLDLGTAADEGD